MIEELQARLREHGYRITPQRVMILEVLAHHRHLPAEEIQARISKQFAFVNLSTIYRTLEMLVSEGMVSRAPIGEGKSYYELAHNSEPHHHLVCRRCGEIEHIATRHLASVERHLSIEHGFQVEETVLTSFGRCKRCKRGKK